MAYTRSDFLWGNGPEYEPVEETPQERLMRLMDRLDREERKTRILENDANQSKLLADLIKGWRLQ